jgi:hypothetical protein
LAQGLQPTNAGSAKKEERGMQMKKKITINSNFHGTSTYVLATVNSCGSYQISKRQYSSAKKRLCVPGCNCPLTIDGHQMAPEYDRKADLKPER